jgi:hypothetical protein
MGGANKRLLRWYIRLLPSTVYEVMDKIVDDPLLKAVDVAGVVGNTTSLSPEEYVKEYV